MRGCRPHDVAQPVGDRLVGRRHIAGVLGGLLGRLRGRCCGSGGGKLGGHGGGRVVFGGVVVFLGGLGVAGLRLAWFGLGGLGLGGVGGRRGDDVGGLGPGGLLRCLCRRGRGGVGLDDVRLEIVDRRWRDIGGFGARDRRVDRKFGCVVAGLIGLRQCRGRRHREKGRRDGHQYAVESGTVVRTVTHYLTPWAILPRREAARGMVGFTLFARATARSVRKTHSVSI
jgi:hypothetical protein